MDQNVSSDKALRKVNTPRIFATRTGNIPERMLELYEPSHHSKLSETRVFLMYISKMYRNFRLPAVRLPAGTPDDILTFT